MFVSTKGPNGSPTYDKAGFELDYDKVADWMKPKSYNKGSMVRGMERLLEKTRQETKRMAEIFFEKGEGPEDPAHAQGSGFLERSSVQGFERPVAPNRGRTFPGVGEERLQESKKGRV